MALPTPFKENAPKIKATVSLLPSPYSSLVALQPPVSSNRPLLNEILILFASSPSIFATIYTASSYTLFFLLLFGFPPSHPTKSTIITVTIIERVKNGRDLTPIIITGRIPLSFFPLLSNQSPLDNQNSFSVSSSTSPASFQ